MIVRTAAGQTTTVDLAAVAAQLAYRRVVPAEKSTTQEVRAAELVAALCLATDLGTGPPFEHGLHATLIAMRLAERLGVDSTTAAQSYYGCLLFYAGCTADAEIAAELFDDVDG